MTRFFVARKQTSAPVDTWRYFNVLQNSMLSHNAPFKGGQNIFCLYADSNIKLCSKQNWYVFSLHD